MKFLIKLFATALGAGYFPVAPGTVGSLVGLALFYALMGLNLLHYTIFVVVFIVFASWISDLAQNIFGKKDPSQVVIDEVAGILVTMAGHAWNWKSAVTGFLLFRFFDIWKPFPIRQIDEKVSNGFGIVLDDVVAGVYANAVLFGVMYFL